MNFWSINKETERTLNTIMVRQSLGVGWLPLNWVEWWLCGIRDWKKVYFVYKIDFHNQGSNDSQISPLSNLTQNRPHSSFLSFFSRLNRFAMQWSSSSFYRTSTRWRQEKCHPLGRVRGAKTELRGFICDSNRVGDIKLNSGRIGKTVDNLYEKTV